MAGEVLVGSALMKGGYSRYFHFTFRIWPESLSAGRRRLHEIENFSNLAVLAIVVIASVCTAHQTAFGGFDGLKPTPTNILLPDWVMSRIDLWMQFFYFATTTFSTVGFGDIHPDDLPTRVLVTFVHFLTFGYVLFLLQTLLGQNDEPAPTD